MENCHCGKKTLSSSLQATADGSKKHTAARSNKASESTAPTPSTEKSNEDDTNDDRLSEAKPDTKLSQSNKTTATAGEGKVNDRH